MIHTCLPALPALPATIALMLGGLATAVFAPQATISAAEVAPLTAATPASSATLPADTRVVVRLHDHARAAGRWNDSPYGTLLATAWGLQLESKTLERPGVFKLLNQLRVMQTALFGITATDQQPLGHLSGTVPAGVTLQLPGVTLGGTLPAVTATMPLQAYQLDHVLRQRGPAFNGSLRVQWDELLPLTAASLTTVIAPEAEAEATWLAALPSPAAPALFTASWTFTPYGLREQLRLRDLPAVSSAAPAVMLDRSALAGLSPTTLWAVATAALPALAERLPGFADEPFDAWAAENGLPAWAAVRTTLGGALLWAEEGSPFPGLTLAVKMPEELGKKMLGLLEAKARFVSGDDGIYLGAMGFVPAQAAWRADWLYLTTASGGIDGAIARPGGFLGVPEIASAERELQNGPRPVGELLALGLSRSAASWNSLASLAGWFTRRTPALATLAMDLKAAGKFGFFALHRSPDAAVLDAGGLLGGPCSTTQIMGAFSRSFMGGGRPVGNHSAPVEPPPSTPAPVEPARMVEF